MAIAYLTDLGRKRVARFQILRTHMSTSQQQKRPCQQKSLTVSLDGDVKETYNQRNGKEEETRNKVHAGSQETYAWKKIQNGRRS